MVKFEKEILASDAAKFNPEGPKEKLSPDKPPSMILSYPMFPPSALI
jgi:hypothetical protein